MCVFFINENNKELKTKYKQKFIRVIEEDYGYSDDRKKEMLESFSKN